MATPIVPPRPSRASGGPTAVRDNLPQVPPRPFRKLDPSPSRENRSPFNELPEPFGGASKRRSVSNLASSDIPPRPPSVTLPSVGQEGSEYASFDQLPPEAHGVSDADSTDITAPEQTRNVSANMPLHAPRASVPQSTAKSRIQTVTRTDSTQAAAAGIGKATPDDDVHKTPADSTTALQRVTSKTEDLKRVPSTEPHPLRQKTSFNRSSSSLPPGASRPSSINESNHEHGIPEIGMQIPLNPNAGDVQAPSPAPLQSQHTPGIGFFNDGSSRAHHRKRSSRQEFGPPGSYGLHSHSQEPHDQFERNWASKNPDKVAKEGFNMYGMAKPETALSSDQLNRIVTQSTDIGMGTDPNMVGTPGEEVAWEASEEYTSRRSSPMPSPAPTTERKKRSSSGATPSAESPLRRTSFPLNQRQRSEDAIESDDGGVIHVNPPERRTSKVTGGGAVDGTIDLGPHAGNTEEEGGWFDERGYGTPILASDEIMKRPGSAYMQPAVNPEMSYDDYESDHGHHESSRRSSLHVPSRPSSRPNSMHGEYQGGNLHRFISHEEHHGSGVHTPLEEIQEYEPLIPEGEEEAPKPKPKALKRPGLEHHHFPSQDMWEDTPSSLQYQTTVETPEPPREVKAVASPPISSTYESAEQEHARKEQNPAGMLSDSKTFLKPQFKAGVQDEIGGRPGMQRFPSQDIWEDTPDSMRLVTTVSSPQMDEVRSPPDDRPTTSNMPGSEEDNDARATTGFTQVPRPSIPARPHRKSKLAEEIRPDDADQLQAEEPGDKEIVNGKQLSPDKAKAPAIPDRPKPTIPARPARPSRSEKADGEELTKSTSVESQGTTDTTAPSVPRTKPAVPARPGSEKIAALKAGFMNDLNNRLKLGPQGPPPKAKEVEPEVGEETQKAPLSDARKGRAKGPARRKPASSPSAAASEEKPKAFSMSIMTTMWHIDENDELQVPSSEVTPAEIDTSALEQVMSENEALNTAEPTLGEPMSPEKAETIAKQPDESSAAEEAEPKQPATTTSVEEQQSLQPELETTEVSVETVPTSKDVELKEAAPIVSPEGAAESTTTAVGDQAPEAVAE